MISPRHVWGVLLKEFRQMRRDPTTLGLIFFLPIMQLGLFGSAVNSDPRRQPTAMEVAEPSPFARDIEAALRNSTYFDLRRVVREPAEGERLLDQGEVQFVVTIPADFERNLVRGNHPQLLVAADATDPAATVGALGALQATIRSALARDLIGPLSAGATPPDPIDLVVHRRYNPESIVTYNIVPGILAIVLSTTMVMMTSMAMGKEREFGTLENLLAMPVKPLEVILGKILPYVIIGAMQAIIVLLAARLVFGVPLNGSAWMLLGGTLAFIAVSLALGFALSTVGENQMQTLQMSMYYLTPSMLLSGFIFPFNGMPMWARWLGEAIPVTHYVRIVRAVMLKGVGWSAVYREFAVLGLMFLVLAMVTLRRYRDTLD